MLVVGARASISQRSARSRSTAPLASSRLGNWKSTNPSRDGHGCRAAAQFFGQSLGRLRHGEPVAFAGGKILHLARERHFALVQDRHFAAKRFHFREQMRVDEDGDAALFEAFQDIADLAAAHGIDAIGGFVQNQNATANE